MMRYLMNWFIYFITLLCVSNAGVSPSNQTDRLALLAFKAKITVDPFDVMSSWNDSVHFCQWYGVTCSSRHQRVTQLSLRYMKLGGSISPHIANLSFLNFIELDGNNLAHQIPNQIGGLQRLQVLVLKNNILEGEIPVNLSKCSELRILSLGKNKLEGEIPAELSLLSKLQKLEAYKNTLVGSIPFSIGNLSNLEVLALPYNNLSGQIPTTLCSLKHLTLIALESNYLIGKIPSSIFNLSSMEGLAVGRNQISGRLPPSMFHTLPHLNFFDVDGNYFTGPIPPSVSNASNIEVLQLLNNRFEGKVPTLENLKLLVLFSLTSNHLGTYLRTDRVQDDLSFLCSLTNATSLLFLEMESNYFRGMLPQCITNLSSHLQSLELSNNYIYGSIPEHIDNLKALQELYFSNNSFTGIIPSTIGNLGNLSDLGLDSNAFSGPIPSSLGKLPNLWILDLSFNRLEGTIPWTLGNYTSLQWLELSYNNLSGSIPIQILKPSLTTYLSLNGNNLTGSLPEEVGKLTNLNYLDVSSNRLCGRIPYSIGECKSLVGLNLSSNTFQGSIPSSLSALKGLAILDISLNNLSGQIPQFLTSFSGLITLNLSFNNFQGPVPDIGAFAYANVTFLQGNDLLCGGIPDFHLPECTSTHNREKRKLSLKLKASIATIIGLACVGLLVLCIVKFMRKRRQRKDGVRVPNIEYHPLLFVSYGDIHEATNSFSEGNLIGMGNFGLVYRGINLHEEGEVVAIKVLNLERLGASRSFVAECQALKNIRHKNLVRLLTVCSGVDYQGNEFKALIYELMPNGSLDQWLHPQVANEQRKLGFLKRMSIAIDIASVLEYVHRECGSPIVHCDIKPSNILLDAEMSARLSDFGLAKFLNGTNSVHHTSSSIGVRGTVGYVAPEYGLGSAVSAQGDVYSLGILLLEMFTGKSPTHEMFKEGLSLHLYAKRALEAGRVADILDHLEAEDQEVAMNPWRSARAMASLVSVVEIGVECSLESPSERMDISMAASQLRRIRP